MRQKSTKGTLQNLIDVQKIHQHHSIMVENEAKMGKELTLELGVVVEALLGLHEGELAGEGELGAAAPLSVRDRSRRRRRPTARPATVRVEEVHRLPSHLGEKGSG